MYFSLVCGLTFALWVALAAAGPKDSFYVMAHMTNNIAATDWALSVGANAVEVDLRFTNYVPTSFKHGGVCDCLCSWIGDDDSVCDYLQCDSQTDATVLLNHFASKSNLALVMIDSKVDFADVNAQRTAGQGVTDILVNELFSRGFLGEVVVTVATVDYFEYLNAVVTSSASTPYASRFHFTFDGEENDIATNFQYMLQLPTSNLVFGTGNTACLPGDFESTMQVAESNRKQGNIGMAYIWTLNLESTMSDYLNVPVGGIMTNYPQRAVAVAASQGFTLATPSARIPAATNHGFDAPCKCANSISGCTISEPAPKYTACNCKAVTCAAKVGACKNSTSNACVNPDTTVRSCLEGTGNCGGYQSCACQLKNKGCVVNKAAASNIACKCNKGLLSCSGDNVLCNNENSPFCVAPDTSKASCLLGGGNCNGY